jgi:hypothetical protein
MSMQNRTIPNGDAEEWSILASDAGFRLRSRTGRQPGQRIYRARGPTTGERVPTLQFLRSHSSPCFPSIAMAVAATTREALSINVSSQI